GNWGNMATPGPDMPIPLAGVYNFEHGFKGNGLSAGMSLQAGPVTPGTSVPFSVSIIQNSGAGAANAGWNAAGAGQLTAPTPGVSRMLYQSSAIPSGFFSGRWMLAT